MLLTDLLRARSARALDEDTDGRLLVASNLTGTFQLYEHQGQALRRLTDFSEPVSGRYLPGGRRAVLSMDDGGNERHQLYLFELDDPPGGETARLVPLTEDPEHVHQLAGVSPDGEHIAYVSNRRNGVDFDLYVIDVASGGHRCLFDAGGWCLPAAGFSPDGRWVTVLRPGERPLDTDLLLVDVASGEHRLVLPHPNEPALVGPVAFGPPGSLFVASNGGRDFCAIERYETESGESRVVLEAPYDLECYASRNGDTLLVVGNVGGSTHAEVYGVHDDGTLSQPTEVALPGRGVIAFSLQVAPPIVSPGGAGVSYTFSSPVVPGDVWRFHLREARLERLTTSPGVDGEVDLLEPAGATVTSFDGEAVPVFVYRPAAVGGGEAGGQQAKAVGAPADGALLPVVLVVHGGPEGQSVLAFSPIVQGLAAAGYAVVVPNVRGSVGYGKRYAALDDTRRRLDSVADLAAIHDWLAAEGLDPDRAALWGGSYGGYMVLAGCAFQPSRWAAGVDIVGISDLVTFLENTSAYRRAHREHEYGSLQHDRDFLELASPLRRVDDMRAPLFVIHGANDPRVPLSEAHQLVDSLGRRGVPCELVVYPDEGHGLQKLANQLDAYPRALAFLDAALGRPARSS